MSSLHAIAYLGLRGIRRALTYCMLFLSLVDIRVSVHTEIMQSAAVGTCIVFLKLALAYSQVFPDSDDALNGLECLVHYMDRHRSELNLDAVFGLRMAEGRIC